jgi:hypothetical protein
MEIAIWLKINTKEKNVIQDALSIYKAYLSKEFSKASSDNVRDEIHNALILTIKLENIIKE